MYRPDHDIIIIKNKNENVHRFALRGELLEREKERERKRKREGKREKEIERSETSKLSLVVLDKNSTKKVT